MHGARGGATENGSVAIDPKATFGTGHFALERAEQIDLRIGKDKPLSKYRREIERDALGDPRMLLAEAVEFLDWQFQARHVRVGPDIGTARLAKQCHLAELHACL